MSRRRPAIVALAILALGVTIGGAVLLSRPSPPLRDASHDSPRLGASGRDDESNDGTSVELAGRPRPVPGDERPSDAVPLVDGVERLKFVAAVSSPASVRLDGIRVEFAVVRGDDVLRSLGEGTTDVQGRCSIGPIPVPSAPRASVASGARAWPYTGFSPNPWPSTSSWIRVRATGCADLRVRGAEIALYEIASPREGNWGVTVIDGADGVRTITAPLYASATALLRGRVVDEDGRPLIGASIVRVTGSSGTEESPFFGATDEDGRFEEDLEVSGKVRLRVAIRAFGGSANPVFDREFAVAPGPAITTIDWNVGRVPTISGRVVGPAGEPMSGVPLALVKAGSRVEDAQFEARSSSYHDAPAPILRVRSGEDGAFRFVGLPTDRRFDVRCWDDDGQEEVGAKDLSVDGVAVTVRVWPRHGIRPRCVDADTGSPVAASIEVRLVGLWLSEEEPTLSDPGEDGFRGRPGKTLRIFAQADRYDSAIVNHVVRNGAGLEDVCVRLAPTRSRARVVVRPVDEEGRAWSRIPALRWTLEDDTGIRKGTGPLVTPVPVSRTGADAAAAGEFETRGLSPGRYLVQTELNACGRPWSGPLQFALPGDSLVEVPSSGEVAVPLTLTRGGALRIQTRGANGEVVSPGDMTSLSARGADGRVIGLQIFARGGRGGNSPDGWTEGIGGDVAHVTQALPPGTYTVEWTGGLHRGSPSVASAVVQVRPDEVSDVEISAPK